MRKIPFRYLSVLAIPLAIAACSAESDNKSPSSNKGGSSNNNNTGGSNNNGSGGSNNSTGGTDSGTGGTSSSTGGTDSGTGGTSSSTGGTSSSTGGTGGGSSASCSTTAKASGSPELIDDFETGTPSAIPKNDGRNGGWWASKSATATLTEGDANKAPSSVEGGNPGKALHLAGSDDNEENQNLAWGAGFSVALAPTKACYDVSAYTGIKLDLKGGGTTKKVWLQVFYAGIRDSTEAGPSRLEIEITDAWKTYEVKWEDLQPGWGTPPEFDKTQVYAIGIAANITPPDDKEFDFWVDNVSFTK